MIKFVAVVLQIKQMIFAIPVKGDEIPRPTIHRFIKDRHKLSHVYVYALLVCCTPGVADAVLSSLLVVVSVSTGLIVLAYLCDLKATPSSVKAPNSVQLPLVPGTIWG
jgi:hypothetical protein